MTRAALIAVFLVGCSAPMKSWDIATALKPGMKLPTVRAALVVAQIDVTTPSLTPDRDPELVVHLCDGSEALIEFRPDDGAWSFISVKSLPLAPEKAEAIRARFGAPTWKGTSVTAVWPNATEFRSYDERLAVSRSLESRSGTTGNVPIGPPGLHWGMSAAELRLVLEGIPGLEEPDSELEFAGEHDWLSAEFDHDRLDHLAYATSPPLTGDAARKRLAELENELGPALRVFETEEWDWPARQMRIELVRVRGESTATVDLVRTN